MSATALMVCVCVATAIIMGLIAWYNDENNNSNTLI